MGNQGSVLGDEPVSSQVRQLQHFDHSFNGEIHTIHGTSVLTTSFGDCVAVARSVQITCTATAIEITEDQGLRARKTAKFTYDKVQKQILLKRVHSARLISSFMCPEDFRRSLGPCDLGGEADSLCCRRR